MICEISDIYHPLPSVFTGDLVKCKVEHDNAGWRPGWFLEKIEITNLSTSKKYVFPCEQWLDEKKGDGLLWKELLPRD